MAALNGKWKLISSENFKEYLDAMGMKNEVKEMAMKILTPDNNITQDINVNGSDVSIVTTTPKGPTECKATIGQESAQKAVDGSSIQVTYTLDGSNLVEEQKGTYNTVIVRSIQDDKLVMSLKATNGVEAVRKYDKI